MVHRVPALLVRIPFEERKLGDPDEPEVVGREARSALSRPAGAAGRARRATSRCRRRAANRSRSPSRAARRVERRPQPASPAAFSAELCSAAVRQSRPDEAARAELPCLPRPDRRVPCATTRAAPGTTNPRTHAAAGDASRNTGQRRVRERWQLTSAIGMPGRRSGLSDPYLQHRLVVATARERRLDREPGGARTSPRSRLRRRRTRAPRSQTTSRRRSA